MKKIVSILLCALLLCAAALAVAEAVPATSTMGWVTTAASVDENSCVTIEIVEAGTFEKKTYTTVPLTDTNALTGATKAQAVVASGAANSCVEIVFDAEGNVIDIVRLMQVNARTGIFDYYMDSAKYGAELTGPGGVPGAMLAEGWVLDTDSAARTITVGDGNHCTNVFEETYTLADDCKVYAVDNSTAVEGTGVTGSWAGEEISLEEIVVCPKGEDGEIYYQKDKYTVLAVFDGDYTTYETAKVVALYFFKNPLVLTAKQLTTPDNDTYDGLGWMPEVSASSESHAYGFDGSCVPFEVMADRMYSIGDSYTNIYLFIGDDGTMTLLDQGNTCASYQYWLNLEKLGFDPRDVDKVLLTHGHGDHYQALVENMTMINHYQVAQGTIAYGQQYAAVQTSSNNKGGFDYLGYPEIGPVLSDKSIAYTLTAWDNWYEWQNDFGGGVEVYPFLTTGHTADTASFIFRLTATENDKVLEAGKTAAFCYMGGYGAQNNLKSGWTRLAYVDGLKYIQSVIAPLAAESADYVYNVPQHSNQYPWYDIAKACQEKNIPFLSVLTEGVDAIQNFCEKRISYNTYERFYQEWLNQTDEVGNLFMEKGGFRSSISSKTLQTIEAYGPYKRAEGTYELEVVSATILHGFDMWQNPSEEFAGMYNIYGFELSEGFVIPKDAFVHEPDTYFVQIVGHVKDDYAGKVDYDTNFYGAENYVQQWTSGPVEIANRPADTAWTEIVRTTRVNTIEEAEALLAAVQAGETYTVQLDKVSDIVVAETPAATFVK